METDPIRAVGPLPQSIDASDTVSKRLVQISNLVDVIHKGGRDYKPRTAMQRLPRHMRRRAMSHNINRLPRKRRDYGKSAAAKSNHRKKPPSRMKRRRPKNLQKEYKKRSAITRWLFTHIFHAKRFQMISLWSYKLPLRSYQRGIRPFLRDARDHAVVFDDSYYRLLRFVFKSAEYNNRILERLQELDSEDYNDFKSNELHKSGYTLFQSDANEITLSIHPLFATSADQFINALGLSVSKLKEDVMKVKAKEFGYLTELPLNIYEGINVTVFDISNLYAKFSFYGKCCLPSINNLIALTADSELRNLNLFNYQSRHISWNNLVDSNSLSIVPDGSSFPLLIEDPRLQPAKRLQREYKPRGALTTDLEHPSGIFDRKLVENFISKHRITAKINELNSTRLVRPTTSDYKIPITIVIRNSGPTPKLELYMPSLSARSLLSLLYRSGVRVGSLSDRYILAVEFNDYSYPYYWLPLTTPKASFRWKRYVKMAEFDHGTIGKWNDLKSFDFLLTNLTTLGNLQQILGGKLKASLKDVPENVLVPIRVTLSGKGRITDNDLIFGAERVKENKKVVHPIGESSIKPDLLMEFESESTLDISKLFGTPKSKKPKLSTPKFEKLSPLGRIIYCRHSLIHGKTEALGFIELKSIVEIASNSGWVTLHNISRPNYIKGRLSIAI